MSYKNEIGVFFHIYKGKTTDKGTKIMQIKNALKKQFFWINKFGNLKMK